MICTKKTAGGNRRQVGKSNCLGEYRPARYSSRPVSQFRDRREDSDAALGWLLIYLTRPLPAAERAFGWALAERWASASVELRSGVTP